MTASVCNTTVLLVKPDFSAAYCTTVIPAVPGISEFCTAQYITTDGKQEVQLFRSLGQNVPSVTVPIPSCHACSPSTPMGTDGINFTGVTVLLNSDSEGTCVQARKVRRRYTRRSKGISKREILRLQKRREDDEALKRIRAVYPKCAECLYQFKSHQLLVKHVCGGVVMSHDETSLLYHTHVSCDEACRSASFKDGLLCRRCY